MPELPEVETIIRGLRPHVEGELLRTVAVRDPSLGPGLAGLELPQVVRAVRRRGKYILFELPSQVLVIHLRMSGRLVWSRRVPPGRVRLSLRFSPGAMHLVDTRRLATAQVGERSDLDLGPDALGDLSWLPAALAGSRAPIKTWLLNQRNIAGIGNIYGAEILFRAGIDPRRPANTLSPAEAERLQAAVPEVLREAIACMGTSLADNTYRAPTGELGSFAGCLRVYGRRGQPCPVCGHPVAQVKLGGRSSYYCPTCQT
ncbi:MAG: bifunctional DNA-formamidopyrimidine glycosylase/DNA-(apurinic or apyrimidinic site) lyase [Candidatus Bipolaricaulaceae bacterium]